MSAEEQSDRATPSAPPAQSVLSQLPRTRPQRSSARRAAAREGGRAPGATSAPARPGRARPAKAQAKTAHARTKAKTTAKAPGAATAAPKKVAAGTASGARGDGARSRAAASKPRRAAAKPKAAGAPKAARAGAKAGRRARPRAGARDEAPVPLQGYASDGETLSGAVPPPGGAEFVATAAEIVGELAKAGASGGERVVKGLLSRLRIS